MRKRLSDRTRQDIAELYGELGKLRRQVTAELDDVPTLDEGYVERARVRVLAELGEPLRDGCRHEVEQLSGGFFDLRAKAREQLGMPPDNRASYVMDSVAQVAVSLAGIRAL